MNFKKTLKKSKTIIALLFSALTIFSCIIPRLNMKDITKDDMPVEDQILLEKALERGKKLVKYDYYCWIASDTLRAHKDEIDYSLLNKYIFSAFNSIPTVYFGKMNREDNFNIAYAVRWVGDSPKFIKFEKDYSLPEIDFRAKALYEFFKVNETEIINSNASYNFYLLPETDTLFIYGWPGSVQSYFLFCGGYKGAYDPKGDSLFYSTNTHNGILSFENPPPANVEGNTRTSMNNIVLTEIDVAQSLIFLKELPRQYIITKRYIFSFKYNNLKNDFSLNIVLHDREQKQQNKKQIE